MMKNETTITPAEAKLSSEVDALITTLNSIGECVESVKVATHLRAAINHLHAAKNELDQS